MRLCSFRLAGEPGEKLRAGVVEGEKVFEASEGNTSTSLRDLAESGLEVEPRGSGYPIAKVVLSAPIPRPGKILATIVNTQAMLGGKDVKLERPRLDMKAASAVIGPNETIVAPRGGIRPEVELAAVVGMKISNASEDEASSAIFGYTVLNDVTAPADSRDDAYEAYRRDRTTGEIKKALMRGPLFRSKNHDTFCPMGPWLVTPDELPNLSNLRMTTRFDGSMVQEGTTAEYLFGPAKIASYVSGFLSLEPGDVISCGSVGWTREALGNLDPTEYLLPHRRGVLELEIEGIGRMVNPVELSP
jgi:2-keto-4-pentenoate hydratase/2-oxohepta-3-ene-1,7-dioic acid hydratase in catechol pathway